MNWQRAMISLVLISVLAGCNLPAYKAARETAAAPLVLPSPVLTVIPPQGPTAVITQTPAASAEPSAAPAASATAPAAPLSSPTAAPSEVVFTPFKATVTVDAVKLRMGPSTLYPALNLMAKGTVLTVYGHSTGGEWAYVHTADKTPGWVFGMLVQAEKPLTASPEVTPGDAQVVRGQVNDSAGAPVNGIQFTFTQGTGSSAPRADATTDASGTFYAFFPASSSGTWTAAYTAISCTSRIMDASCGCLNARCGTAHPASTQVTLPYDQTLVFTWQ